MRKIGDLGFSGFPLGDVYRSEEDSGRLSLNYRTGVDRDVDRRLIRLEVPPRLPGESIAASAVEAVEMNVIFRVMEIEQRCGGKLVSPESVMLESRCVGAQDDLIFLARDEHRHGIGLEQHAEGSFPLLQLADIDAQPDDTAIARESLIDEYAAAV